MSTDSQAASPSDTTTGSAPSSSRAGDVTYTSSNIQVLEGLDPVRKRPGMYIGSTGAGGLHHLVYEVVDNSVDEAMAGYCSRIEIKLLADGGCRVSDDGRGIPVDIHPAEGRSAAELVLTKLHAGGKFGEGGGYKVSGGLHGVGVSVVNALARRLELEIDRDGRRWEMSFGEPAAPGEPNGPLTEIGPSPNGHSGTTVTFWPDGSIMEETRFRAQTLVERFQMMAFLNRGLEIAFTDERPDSTSEPIAFRYDGGIIDFVAHLNEAKAALFATVGHFAGSDTREQQEVEVAFQWNTGFNADGIHSFANGIATVEGGMHEEGFKKSLTTVVGRYARDKGLVKDNDEKLAGEDIREGLTAIVSVRLAEPQFEGQTKGKLGNPSIRSLVEKVTNERLAEWLEEHPNEAKLIVRKATEASRARIAARKARDAIRVKSSLEGAGMPDKLRDCSSRDPDERELFIVEGDSAGGSATQARDPRTQAILPIRGKILNVERARVDKMLANNEVKTIISALGAGVGEPGDDGEGGFDVTKARYHKVILMADADVDGSHIRTLLLTLFFRQMRPLVEHGYVYIAQPPLYSTVVGKDKLYLKDDAAKDAFVAEHPDRTFDFQRLKGLGEMDWDELGETTMDRSKRTLLRVSLEQAAIADEVVAILMGEDVASRRHFIQSNAKDVRFLDT